MIVYPEIQPHDGDVDLEAARKNVERVRGLSLSSSVTPENLGTLVPADQTIAIIGLGPAVRKAGPGEAQTGLEKLNANKDRDGNPMIRVAASGGWNLVESQELDGVDSCVIHMAGNDVVGTVPNPRKDVVYHLASMCISGETETRPAVEHHFAEFDVRLWHAYLEGESPFAENDVAIGAGTGAPIAAMALYAAMGARKFEVFGMGGGFEHAASYTAEHEYPDGMTKEEYIQSLKDDFIAIRLDGKIYHLPGFVWAQAEEIMTLIEIEPEISVHFHGDPLFIAIFNTPSGKPRSDYEILDPNAPAFGADGPVI